MLIYDFRLVDPAQQNPTQLKVLLVIVVVVVAVLVFSFYCFFNRLGELVNAAHSDSYYHHARKKLIVYSPMGNWFELGYYETEADPESFTVISREYGKDKKRIFWKGKAQPVDYRTFYIDEEGVPKDALHVYYEKKYQDTLAVIPSADPETYRCYKEGTEANYEYLHQDKNFFYLNGNKIEVDRKTFVRLNLTLGVDKNHVYAIVNRRAVIPKLDTPPGDAAVISDNYARIGNAIIFSNWKTDFSVVNFPTIDSVHVLNDRNISVNGQLVRDGAHIPSVDLSTWEEMGPDHFKDRNSVYFEGLKIDQANAATFKVVAEGYGKDDQHVFYQDKKLNGADPVSFKYEFSTALATDGKLFFKNGEAIDRK